MSEPVVQAVSLHKQYGDFVAVRGVDFRIESGECFGFLGPNGAGKTSTMRMMQAVSLPDPRHPDRAWHGPGQGG